MAEEEGTNETDQRPKNQGQRPSRRRQNWPDKYHVNETIYHGPCNVRIHELSQPKRWLLFNTYKSFNKYFKPERAQAVKEKVQELFSMTPEETELYFNTIRQKRPRKTNTREIRKKLQEEKLQARREAYQIIHTIICRALKYSYCHAPPLLVSPMMRIISDHMLQFLADLNKISVPKRTNTDKLSQLLISAADWCSLFIANIYYEIEVEERKERNQKLAKSKLPSDSTSSTESSKATTEQPTKVTDYAAPTNEVTESRAEPETMGEDATEPTDTV